MGATYCDLMLKFGTGTAQMSAVDKALVVGKKTIDKKAIIFSISSALLIGLMLLLKRAKG